MDNLVPELLPRLENHRIAGLDTGPATLHPYYDGLSLANIPAGVCHWLGIPEFGGRRLDEAITQHLPGPYRHVILMVVDGFGLDMLQGALQRSAEPEYAVWAEMGQRAVLAPLTSIAPSTTAAALTTFWTGCTPAQHGVLAYEVWLKEYAVLANMILHSPATFTGAVGSLRSAGFNPETFLPVPTFGPHLAAHGVQARAYQHASIAKSGLSTMLFNGVEVSPFRSLSDLWVTLAEHIARRDATPTYSYIYWGDLDEHSHKYGPGDERVALELESFSRQLGHFYRKAQAGGPGDTLLLITADHGHMFTPKDPRNEVRNHPELLECLVMQPSCEARMPVVYLRPGCEERFLRYVEQTWPGEFSAIPSQQAVASGLFGSPVYRRFPERVGDFVLIPRGDGYWWFSDRDNVLLGRHGGLSKTEMLVPLFAVSF